MARLVSASGWSEPNNIMAKLNKTGGQANWRERRYRRFSLRYPVDVKVDLGTSIAELHAISHNISRGGVLLEADSAIPQHCGVSFVMKVEGNNLIGPTQIAGEGEVVRVEPNRSGAGFSIAVKCKHPISKLRSDLRAWAS
jgi:hypothetical protein